ncbi:hypothetical protein KQI22_04430 [Kineothrix sp. MSJ-39]|uniref:hypothetical protein n=1 Tax=Kineothrix sp. MSJ-39 TaxID=2841533 RepID=UPI001C1161AD|nr:hypothetical protein [Kineothrix sp. MSJ-39]MBU5429318.1 hypothetical protein [Kineothrix sp. MSJ-39]
MKLRYYMRGLGIGIFVTAILMALTIHGKTERLTDEQIIERAEALGMEMKYSSDVLADTVSENAAEDTKSTELSDQVKEETSLANQLAAEEKTENPLLDREVGNTDAAEAGMTDSLQQDIYHEDPDAAERTETKTGQTDGSADADSTAESTADESSADEQDESAAGDTEQTDAAGSSIADTDTQAAGSKQITVSSGDGSDTVARKLYEAGLVSDAAAYDKYLCQNGYDKKICTGVKTIPAGSGEAEIAKILTTR